MYGNAAIAETALAESLTDVAPIIPEVGNPTRELVFVLEIEMIAVAGADLGPGGVHEIAIVAFGGEDLEFGGSDVEY